MSERLITLSNVPDRQFTQHELLMFQAEGVHFTYGYHQHAGGCWNFLGLDATYGVHYSSMELFNKLSQPGPTFEDVKLKLKEAQQMLVKAQEDVAKYEAVYKKLVAAEEFGFSIFKKA